ncbi:MAG TPA: hypothetical protein DCY41_03675 [Opitutae bacterium]|nr:hypothetical protein [Opitutae bacterium]
MNAMDSRTRFIVFGVGACLGAFILWFFNQHGKPAREHRKSVMVSLSLPGMYYDSAVQQKPLFGHFILAERRTKRADGTLCRELITGGRNRFAEDGRALPNDLILVTEDYALGVEPAEEAKVAAVSFAFADRADVVFQARMRSTWKWNTLFELKSDQSYEHHSLRLRDVAKLKGDDFFALVEYVRHLEHLGPPVVSASLGHIDWKAEADLIRKESGQ